MKSVTIKEILAEALLSHDMGCPVRIRKRKKKDALIINCGVELTVEDNNGQVWTTVTDTDVVLWREA